MNCKNLKQKLNRTLYCKYKKSDIKISECSNCEYKEYKLSNNNRKTPKIKSKSNKLAKLERDRFSIFSDNIDKCYLCSATDNLTWHELYRGRNRANSMKYGLCLRLCINCHELYQEDVEFNNYWHKKGQKKYMEYYHKSIDEFRKIFGKNYL